MRLFWRRLISNVKGGPGVTEAELALGTEFIKLKRCGTTVA
jgi:hypothetical protein